ncbi:MAG: peptidylprolyl isomerase [Methylococcales bacterium]|jgi:FKBP-type peptidyl-prolyl cis-trans isomerase SlyD|nr:peptidylprolyl isomerase [Methylococcales bacterium]MBT7411295.1 peptidylprolyl isomerase [Methylococcales bacterium]
MNESIIKFGSKVELAYTINDLNEEVLEHTSLPISYEHGKNSGLFKKIEANLSGKKVGDIVNVTLLPEEGFGYPNERLTFTDDINNVPEQFRKLGAEVEFKNDKGESKQFTVSKIENGQLTVDGNHPFAGKTVIFRIKVMSIK